MHAAEDILSAVRTGDRPVTQALIGDCLTCLDQVVKWLDAIQDSGELPSGTEADVDDIVARFAADSHDTNAEPIAQASAALALVPTSSIAVLKEQISLPAASGDGAEGRRASAGRLAANVLRHLARDNEAEQVERALLQSQTSGGATHLTAAIERAIEQITQPAPSNAIEVPAPQVAPTLRTLRVTTERVNDLVNVTGELIVAKNAVGHIAKLASETNNALAAAIRDEHARLDHLIESLQSAVRAMRVLPLRVVFQRFSRLVREMSESLSKPVRLVTEGEETEADKAIVEMLFEPLLHVVRNAMDHGVEPPEQRVAAGKPSLATLSLRARRDGEHVVVECEDDGNGIDVDKIRKVVAERRLVSLDVLTAMSDIEVINLIFMPGFSTARNITDVSGRGVGMGAARTAVERLCGRVFVETRLGKGSIVRFILPFSVMMMRVLMVEIGRQIFGIPLDAVVETVCIRREQIHLIGSSHAFVLRNLTIPLIELSWTLDRSGEHAPADATIVVVASGDQLVGLHVDRLGTTMDVMLKPPGGLLSGVPGIAGTAMLGDGTVLLVLSIQDVLQ